MTTPCDKGPMLERMENKLESIHNVVTDIALQNQRITTLETASVDHEGRIRKIEKTPIRVLYWIAGIAATVIGGFFTHRLWG